LDRSIDARIGLGIGTSFGLFLTDLEELSTMAVVDAVRFALRRGRPALPLARWAEEEPEVHLRRTLAATVVFHRRCQELHQLAREAQGQEDLERFADLYQEVARLQGGWPTPFWPPIPTRTPATPAVVPETIPSARWVQDRALELVVADGSQGPPPVARIVERLSPGGGLASWLPSGAGAPEVLRELLDLALMPPIGRLHKADAHPWDALRLLPGGRLRRAVEILERGEIPAGPGWLQQLCDHEALRWPAPVWLAFKARESPPLSLPGFRGLRRAQRRSAALRLSHLGIAAQKALPPSSLVRRALAARRRRALVAACVDVWIGGGFPAGPPDAPWPAWSRWSPRVGGLTEERFAERLARTFEELFQIPLAQLRQLHRKAG
jgi:hypothetical protein